MTSTVYSVKGWKGAGFFLYFYQSLSASSYVLTPCLHYTFIQAFAVKLYHVFLSLPSQGLGDKPACGQYCCHSLQKLPLYIPTAKQADSSKNTSVNKWVIAKPGSSGQERATNQSGENKAGDLMFLKLTCSQELTCSESKMKCLF